jgi:hypothetical protein
MSEFRQTAIAFVAAALVTAILASVFSTQVVIAGLQGIDVEVPFATRVAMTLSDLPILAMFVPAAAACFLPGFLIASLLAARTPLPRTFWFVLAGASAFLVELKIIEGVLGLMPIGGARSAIGLVLQSIAGATGGWVFARLSQPQGRAA